MTVISSTKSSCSPITSGVFWDLTLEPVLAITLMTWMVGQSASSASLQMIHNWEEWLPDWVLILPSEKECNRLEIWAGQNLMKFNEVLDRGWNNPVQQHRLEIN